jgi:hypothetical protein
MALCNFRVHNQVKIGRIHIAITEDLAFSQRGKGGNQTGLARTPFTACHTDNHIYSPELNIKRPAYHFLVYLNLFLLN